MRRYLLARCLGLQGIGIIRAVRPWVEAKRRTTKLSKTRKSTEPLANASRWPTNQMLRCKYRCFAANNPALRETGFGRIVDGCTVASKRVFRHLSRRVGNIVCKESLSDSIGDQETLSLN